MLVLNGLQNKRRLCNRSSMLYKLPCHLGHEMKKIQ